MRRKSFKHSVVLSGTVLLAIAVGVAGCGRKGPLERPKNTASAGAPATPAADATVRGPDKRFILDRLLR
ncbi:MAG: hypothetical protein D6773_00050 [Alphaproteobacteria bacterium]|nr:MAG: hypothetical protein D6773_00050 [Alphaproteobacteria bacterium]